MATEIIFHKLEIKRNGKRVGILLIGKKGLQWRGPYDRKWGNVTWGDFARGMTERIKKQGPGRWK